MTFLELRAELVRALNRAAEAGMTPEEVYGVVASIEAEVRYGLLGSIKTRKDEP